MYFLFVNCICIDNLAPVKLVEMVDGEGQAEQVDQDPQQVQHVVAVWTLVNMIIMNMIIFIMIILAYTQNNPPLVYPPGHHHHHYHVGVKIQASISVQVYLKMAETQR